MNIYAEVLVTSFLAPESFLYKVPSRDINIIEWPQSGFAYRFFEHPEANEDKVKQLIVRDIHERRNCSNWTYFGTEYTLEDVEKMDAEPHREEIIEDMKYHNNTRVVKTIFNGWYPLNDGDVVTAKQN